MADPAIQTFCCIANNRTRLGLDSLLHYRYESYNYVCIVSSLIGILGATYQILPRSYEGSGRVLASFLRGRQIIVWLATADLLASFAVLIRSASWLLAQTFSLDKSYYFGSMFCAISSGWIQYFYGVTYLWTLIYAVDVLRIVEGLRGSFVVYHILVWTVPGLCTVIGLMLLYYPDLSCHSMEANVFHRILPNYLLTCLPIMFVMLANPLIYLRASRQAEKVITSSGRFTSNERRQLRILRLKFLSINLVFLFCWLPNLINAIAVWTLWFHLPRDPILISAFFMAFLNPLQAVFNVFVYRKWGESSTVRIRFPWRNARERLTEEIHLLDGDPNGNQDGTTVHDLSSLSGVVPSEKAKSSASNHSINGYGSF